jgi:hypothetical protein
MIDSSPSIRCQILLSNGHRAQKNTFDFANRNSILFKWNDKVNKQQEGLVEEDLIPYPSLAVQFQGVTPGCDTPAIEDEIVSQGRMQNAAA